jgi:general stress protein 26
MDALSRSRAVELMEGSEAAYLATIGADGYPSIRAMLNLRNPNMYPRLAGIFKGHREDLLVYFTTNTSSGKVAQVMANPRVSVYYCIPGDWRGLMLVGDMEVVADAGVKHSLWQEEWSMYYPGGPGDPDYAILRLLPRLGKGYHQMSFYTLEPGRG